MKRLLGSAICLGLATLCAPLLLGVDDPSGSADEQILYTYSFSKREFASAGRTSFTLEVKPNRPGLLVTALCSLHDEQQGIGRFPLANVNVDDADTAVRFRIACLSDAYTDNSTIRVEIRDQQTETQVGVLEISLLDAVPEVASSSVKER